MKILSNATTVASGALAPRGRTVRGRLVMRGLCFGLLVAIAVSLPATGYAATSVGKLFERVKGSVVVVHTIQREVVSDRGQRQEVSGAGLGSGVVIDSEGHIMTAAHVVQYADYVEIEFLDGEKAYADIIASDPMADLALLKLAEITEKLVTAKLGDSEKTKVGDEVFLVGAPYGLSHSLTVGHISARHRAEDLDDTYRPMDKAGELFQTDAAINRGNSGGPMFNMKGEVVGIASRILSQSGGFEGVGFAVTSNTARRILLEEQVLWSGISGMFVAGNLARILNVPQPAGYLVQHVARNSPAASIGLREGSFPVDFDGREVLLGGDIILAINEIPIARDARQALRDNLRGMKAGDKMIIRVLRDGQQVELTQFKTR